MQWFGHRTAIAAGLALVLGFAPGAVAQAPLEGFVIARKACMATPSIRGGADRRAERLTIDRAYPLLGENQRNGSHYQIAMPGEASRRLWIAKDCGDRVRRVAPVSDPGLPVAPSTTRDDNAGRNAHRDLLLAISWQPAFCETRPRKPECRSQTRRRFDADHFTLHGLWPQPRGTEYCGVGQTDRRVDRAGRWHELPPVRLKPGTAAALAEAMPGTRSALDRHEWLRHGTCYRADEEEYFADSLLILDAINASPVRDLFARSVGRRIGQAAVRAAFDRAFGRGAGQRVRLGCANDDGRRIVTELTIALRGEITPETDIGALIRSAPRARGGCRAGIVDAVGLQ